ncbi:DUF433 domain-containing protein [Kitasatospora sp. NPDC059571]|uniref:DUF433 domain-containing protein n=1 Tax=Kitasatospora sp. NPDC059571 TaxID=3346871 RepID=UPI003688932C
MVDKLHDPLLTVRDAARHLMIPDSTMYRWTHQDAAEAPIVHSVTPLQKGWPSIPFVAIVEGYVARALREVGLSLPKIREAAAAVRQEFGDPYGLATRRIATDGVDIFAEFSDGDLARVCDKQRPFREFIQEHLRYIHWDKTDDYPQRLRLRQYHDVAPVIIDPRFGWGAPVLESTKIPVDAVVGLWTAGESFDDIADEYQIGVDQVEEVCRVAAIRAA